MKQHGVARFQYVAWFKELLVFKILSDQNDSNDKVTGRSVRRIQGAKQYKRLLRDAVMSLGCPGVLIVAIVLVALEATDTNV